MYTCITIGGAVHGPPNIIWKCQFQISLEINPELPYEIEFECESAIRRIEELDEDQTAELCRVCLRHNFSLVNFLRQAIDRVQHLEIVIDELCELEDSQS
jgi:hypothetical protein